MNPEERWEWREERQSLQTFHEVRGFGLIVRPVGVPTELVQALYDTAHLLPEGRESRGEREHRARGRLREAGRLRRGGTHGGPQALLRGNLPPFRPPLPLLTLHFHPLRLTFKSPWAR